MNNQKICFVIERLQNDERISAFCRAVLPKFDSEVSIVETMETANEHYFVLKKIISGKPTNFILIATIRRRMIDKIRCWEVMCFFEKDKPPYYNCPQKFFELCPTVNPLSLEWRAKNKEFQLKKNQKAKNSRQLFKLVEAFEVGDTLIHPVYGELYVKHINLMQRALWCLNQNHQGTRKYKLPLMSLEDWEKNIERKKSLKLGQCS